MALFYIQQDSKQVGPYTAKEIKQAVKAGRLARTDHIRVGEDGPWEIIEDCQALRPQKQHSDEPAVDTTQLDFSDLAKLERRGEKTDAPLADDKWKLEDFAATDPRQAVDKAVMGDLYASQLEAASGTGQPRESAPRALMTAGYISLLCCWPLGVVFGIIVMCQGSPKHGLVLFFMSLAWGFLAYFIFFGMAMMGAAAEGSVVGLISSFL